MNRRVSLGEADVLRVDLRDVCHVDLAGQTRSARRAFASGLQTSEESDDLPICRVCVRRGDGDPAITGRIHVAPDVAVVQHSHCECARRVLVDWQRKAIARGSVGAGALACGRAACSCGFDLGVCLAEIRAGLAGWTGRYREGESVTTTRNDVSIAFDFVGRGGHERG